MERSETDARLTSIHALLYRLGARASLRGFRYAAYAIFLGLQSPERLARPTETIYPEVARRYHTDPEEASRNIRRVVFLMWKENPRRLQALADAPLDAPPTPKRFLSLACRYLEKREHERKRGKRM